MPTSLVENLRPIARDQLKFADSVLRAVTNSTITAANGTGEVLRWDMTGYASFVIQLTGDSNSFAVQGSNDGDQWGNIDVRTLGDWETPPMSTGVVQDNNGPTFLAGNKQTRFMRIFNSAASSRPAGVLVLRSQTPFVPVKQIHRLSPAQAWSYVAALGGIPNTTPVTLKSAVNTSHRNLLTGIEVDNGGTAGTEVILKEGSNVIWRAYLGAGATKAVSFDPPLRAGANAAITAELSSSTNVAVYVNARGTVSLA